MNSFCSREKKNYLVTSQGESNMQTTLKREICFNMEELPTVVLGCVKGKYMVVRLALTVWYVVHVMFQAHQSCSVPRILHLLDGCKNIIICGLGSRQTNFRSTSGVRSLELKVQNRIFVPITNIARLFLPLWPQDCYGYRSLNGIAKQINQ